jgi:hypothetical protein
LNINDLLSIAYYKSLLHLLNETQLQSLSNIPTIPKTFNIQEANQKPHCYTDFEPRIQNSISDIIFEKKNWYRNISFFDEKAVEKSILKNFGYIDRKYIFVSEKINATISFKIVVKHKNPIWVCEVQKGFLNYPSYMGSLHESVDVFLFVDFSNINNNDDNLNINNNNNNNGIIYNNNNNKSLVLNSTNNFVYSAQDLSLDFNNKDILKLGNSSIKNFFFFLN